MKRNPLNSSLGCISLSVNVFLELYRGIQATGRKESTHLTIELPCFQSSALPASVPALKNHLCLYQVGREVVAGGLIPIWSFNPIYFQFQFLDLSEVLQQNFTCLWPFFTVKLVFSFLQFHHMLSCSQDFLLFHSLCLFEGYSFKNSLLLVFWWS